MEIGKDVTNCLLYETMSTRVGRAKSLKSLWPFFFVIEYVTFKVTTNKNSNLLEQITKLGRTEVLQVKNICVIIHYLITLCDLLPLLLHLAQ